MSHLLALVTALWRFIILSAARFRALDYSFRFVDQTPPQKARVMRMEFSVLLFASLKDAAGAGAIMVRFDKRNAQEVTVDELLRLCGEQHPALAKWLPYVSVAVNCEYATGAQSIGADDEIAFLPPVSGGV